MFGSQTNHLLSVPAYEGGLPVPVGARFWASYATTSRGWNRAPGTGPGCGRLSARSDSRSRPRRSGSEDP